MKKVALIFVITLFLCANTKADVCVEVNEEVASKAVNIIKKQKEIYDYCSICNDAKSRTIFIRSVTKDKKVYVNGIAIDLAHTYFKQDSKYVNLGIASGCIEDGVYGISAKLDDLAEFHHTNKTNKEQAQEQAKAIFDECTHKVENNLRNLCMVENYHLYLQRVIGYTAAKDTKRPRD